MATQPIQDPRVPDVASGQPAQVAQLVELLQMLGLGAGPARTQRPQGNTTPSGAIIPPGGAFNAITGGGGTFPGYTGGPFTFVPGPAAPSNPFLGMLGESFANGTFAQLMQALGRGGAGGAGSAGGGPFGGGGIR